MDQIHPRLVRTNFREFLQRRQFHSSRISGVATLRTFHHNNYARDRRIKHITGQCDPMCQCRV